MYQQTFGLSLIISILSLYPSLTLNVLHAAQVVSAYKLAHSHTTCGPARTLASYTSVFQFQEEQKESRETQIQKVTPN